MKLRSGVKILIKDREATIKAVSYLRGKPDQVLLYFNNGPSETISAALLSDEQQSAG